VRLKISWLTRLKRSHALEHATMHILGQQHFNIRLIGRSDPWGFTLTGNVETAQVVEAVSEALARLQGGERELAVHPHCGTNLAMSVLLAGLSSFVAMSGKTRSRWEKLPRALLACMGALLVAQPLGLWVQQHITTTPALEGTTIRSISCQKRRRVVSHRIRLEHR